MPRLGKNTTYSTVGFHNNTYGTFLIKAQTPEGALRKSHKIVGKYSGTTLDTDDLAKVTNDTCWTSIHKLITQINNAESRYPKKVQSLGFGVYFKG